MPRSTDGPAPVDLVQKRNELHSKIIQITTLIKELKVIENEEYELSKKYEVSSMQSEYVEVPMPDLGVIATYDGFQSANWATMHLKIAESFCFDSDTEA